MDLRTENLDNPYTCKFDPEQKKLTVRQAVTFPQEVYDYTEEVEILDMSFGHMTTLPEDIGRFRKMRIAFLSNHDFEEVPETLAGCSNLELVGLKSCKIKGFSDHALPVGLKGLILTDNQLTTLPDLIGEYVKLKKLMLAGNHLQSIPEGIVGCQQLELLRLSVNNFNSSPDWLFELPNLAWYTDAGNPFHGSDRIHIQGLKEIPWDEVELGEKIGESARNIVYKARLKDGTEVAVKIFGSGLTADGYPIDDMNACLLAGAHDNIIGGIARLVHSSADQHGLIMPLIPEDFKSLGKPPDFSTLTRDVYPHVDSLTLSYIINVMSDIASAMRHCHSKGVMHGDIYGHNILADAQGNSYIGDFGAASLYPPTNEGKLRELIDVRGFGYLMDDLLSKCAKNEGSQLNKIEQLRQACLNTVPVQRPSFSEIHKSLQLLI